MEAVGLASKEQSSLRVVEAVAQDQDLSPLVFVVDDDPSIVRMIGWLLKQAGFRTASAGDIASALQGIREQRPDLILLDVNLPDGSGFEVLRTLQSENTANNTPILFISANDDIATKVQGFEIGGVDYITKPIVGAEVIARVRTHLRLKRAYERLAELQTERVQLLANAQQSLMPRPEDRKDARFQVSLHQVSAAGGDFYDVISAGQGIVDYLIADASGHDLAASFWTASLKALATEYATPLNLPLEIVQAINSSLCRLLPPGAFFTLLYARLNHRTGRFTLVNAGHPPAILLPTKEDAATILRQEGDVVGAFSDATFGVIELTLQPGDRVFFYTDGLIEATGIYEERLQSLADACQALRGLPLDEMVPVVVNQLMDGLIATDDTLLMGVEN
jgi:sigma-B regulation protein RsbU (phosphoserine phosphatase)